MKYVLLEDSRVDTINCQVSVNTTHFSTYLLVDKEIWLDAWRKEITYDDVLSGENVKYESYDIFLCLDCSVSLEEMNEQIELSKLIVEQMDEKDRISIGFILPYGKGGIFYLATTNETSLNRILNNSISVLSKNYDWEIPETGTYHVECNGVPSLLSYMANYGTNINKDTNVGKMGIFINAGKNEKNGQAIQIKSETDARNDLSNIGFPLFSISITDDENTKFASLLEEYGGKSYIATTTEMKIDWMKDRVNANNAEYELLDSDGDGIYDTMEINGIRIQNGTIAYTDPYKADTDGDGLSDFAELGGLPQEFMNYYANQEFVSTINYQKSNPNDPNSAFNKEKNGFMIVDDFDYLPYNKSTYNTIFIDDTDDINMNGEAIYGAYNIYGSNINEMTPKEIKNLVSRVRLVCALSNLTPMFVARDFLTRYVDRRDDRNIYDVSRIMDSSGDARDMWAESLYHLMCASEEVVGKNQTKILTQTPNNEDVGVSFKWYDPSGLFAIKDGVGRSVGKVTFDGEYYRMDYKFYLFDYYDWNKDMNIWIAPGIKDSELYQLCRTGNAKFYENWGKIEGTLYWLPNADCRDYVLAWGKLRMANGLPVELPLDELKRINKW